MHGVRIKTHGDVEVLEWTAMPDPTPGPGEVRVALQAAGLNHLDLWVRRGVPGHRFPLPLVPGSDGAGIVVERGPGCAASAEWNIQEGDEVILNPGISCGRCEACLRGQDPLCRGYGILGETRDGTCAESIVLPATNVMRKPAGIDFPTAACFSLTALTAWTMLVERARIQPGEEVLVLAGGSGVGTQAIQIARMHSCRVLASGGGAKKCSRLTALGADAVIDHNCDPNDFVRQVKELTGGRGVDIVFEHVGEATWQASLRSLARGGRLVTCGATTGPRGESDLRLIFYKGLSILGSTMGSKGTVPRLIRFLAEGKLRPIVGRTLPITEVAEAHRLLEGRQVFGKVVLTIPAE